MRPVASMCLCCIKNLMGLEPPHLRDSKMSHLTILVSFCYFQVIQSALVGYDCSDSLANITAISSFSVTPCQEEAPAERHTLELVQVVQERGYSKVRVQSCLITRSSLIYHCGMHSHSSVGTLTVEEIIHPSREKCLSLHSHGSYETGSGAIITGIRVNATTQQSLTEMGSTSSSFSCKGASFTLNGQSFESAVMQSSYSFVLAEEWATVDLDTGMVRTSGGYAHLFRAGRAFDAGSGDMYWDAAGQKECSKTSYIVLYEGPASVYKNHAGQKTIVVNGTSHAMALGLLGPSLVCHQHALATEHPKIFIIPKNVAQFGFYFEKSPIDPEDIDMFLYVNSKLVYLEQHVGKEITSVYHHFRRQMCEMRHQLLRHLTTIAVVAPEEFAWLYAQRPGVTAIIRGEIIYLMECQAVPVVIRKPPECFNELPVSYNNTPKFMKAKSRILVDFGTKIDCSPTVPAGFRLEGQWWALKPTSSLLPEPVQLSAEEKGTQWKYSSPPNLYQAGIYTKEELLKYQKRLLFDVEKPIIGHSISSAVAGRPANLDGLDGTGIFHPGQLEELQRTFMQKAWGFYWDVSVVLGGLGGLYLVIMFIKTVLSSLITCTCLYRAYGCGLELLTCFFGTCAKFLLTERQLDRGHRSGWESIRAWYRHASEVRNQRVSEELELTQLDNQEGGNETQQSTEGGPPQVIVEQISPQHLYPEVRVTMERSAAP
uniref:Glycoprotein n=1 Tax=Canne point virus TaxID=2485866 RepID=A0A3G3BTL0_9VIRU|nr:glycoprotein [Canne point virus]